MSNEDCQFSQPWGEQRGDSHLGVSAPGRSTSFFEFWPTWLIYLPVAFLWLGLAVRYRSLTLPLLANPRLTMAGMVSMPKSELMSQAEGDCKAAILPWIAYRVTDEPVDVQVETFLGLASAQAIELPMVCKPDIGCRGVGVKLIRNREQLHKTLEAYPPGASVLGQKLSNWQPEVGIFYIKDPESGKTQISSMTFKNAPQVQGDGERTLEQLVATNARAEKLKHLYQQRHQADWHRVLEPGETLQLIFSASHCSGAEFLDARRYVTPQLTRAIERIMAGLPEFYYGRLDVKFPDLASLMAGEQLEIVEINAASSESIHIWDKNARLLDAVKTLLWQFRTLFRMGQYQRKRGHKPPGFIRFIKAWRADQKLAAHYPETD